MLLTYFLAWFPMIILAVANGALRDLGYKQYVGELAAHQISTATLLVLFTVYFFFLTRYRPIESGS